MCVKKRWQLPNGVWELGVGALGVVALFLFRDRAQVVDDVPDLVVLQLILPWRHVEVRCNAILDVVEDRAIGRSVIPRVVGEIRRGRDEIVARAAFGVDAVTRRAALSICALLLYFLLLLAYRAFTGRGRKQDGGLLPPWAMKGFIHAFGIVAVILVVVGVYQGELRSFAGGLGYLLTAYVALYAYDKRKRDPGA